MKHSDIFAFFEKEFQIDSGEIDATTGLYSEGLLDSFSINHLVLLEDSAGITVEPSDVTLDNLDSVEKIVDFVEAKLSISAQ